MESPLSYFSSLHDPRVERSKEHLLEDIIVIAILSVICGAETWNEMEAFGKSKESWLKTILRLPNGIPSHDTINRVFSLINPQELEACFVEWTKSVARMTDKEVVSIDGKTMRGASQKSKDNKNIVHIVSAWAGVNHVVLGQVKVEEKSNEIPAIPKLLELLVLKGCIVTIDAMGCQKEIAEKIVAQEADYLLALKGNQGNLQEAVEDSFRLLPVESSATQVEGDHGRVETRTCSVITDLSMVENKEEWSKLKSLIRIESERYFKVSGETQTETRYYISSLGADATLINQSVRAHWGVENSLHWVLDIAFHEDSSRKRAGYAAQNFSMMCRIALNLLKNDKTTKIGVKSKRLKAGWDSRYLADIVKI